MGKLLTSHRSTTYPCCLPALGRFEGAGRIRLTRHEDRDFRTQFSFKQAEFALPLRLDLQSIYTTYEILHRHCQP